MDIEFRQYDGTATAKNPRIERRGEVFTLKFDEKDCEYFLLISRVPSGKVDLNNPDIQKALIDKKDRLINASNERLTEGTYFSLIEWSEYRVNDYAIDLPSQIAEYTLFGCNEENGKYIIYIPNDEMSCTASIALTVGYRITQVSDGGGAPRFFGKKEPNRMYYAVEFDQIPNYQDGSIVYRFDDDKWSYPVTGKLIENGKFYIDGAAGMPRFFSMVSGLELRKN
ncbi:hypothetical protein [Butyrivibrio sp. VCB2001]|uniref:hypothetical protein n=1 Tax=Butyrivibrio sp. VCB2001 TaxID=1280667 RepID=UPI000419274A|nr:hypothetical protein [Butyrivibrio sp. VCB2001]